MTRKPEMSRRPERALLAAALGALVCLTALILVALARTGSIVGLDPIVLRWVREQTGDAGTAVTLARDITALGNDATLWIVVLLGGGFLAAGRQWRALGHLLGATAVGGLLTTTIKAVVHRPRPTIVAHLVEAHSASFPSGHAMNSAFVYGTLAVIAARAGLGSRQRSYLTGAALLLALMIGTSRVVLGVHWPTDVLAGWSIGLGWAAFAGALPILHGTKTV